MLEISPVLTGKFDSTGHVPAVNNLMSASAAAAGAADVAGTAGVTATSHATESADAASRRYTKFDHSVTNAGDAPGFSFGDFLDLVNPLQHIPLVSSVYRAATGDTINPVSRVAGDILYGGALGGASAVLGGIGAVGDALAESQTGKDATGTVIASLFGHGDTQASTQVAEADAKTSTPAATQPSVSATTASVVTAPLTPAPSSAAATASAATASAETLAPVKGFPLDRSKLPYGGVMDPRSLDTQNAAMALAEGSHTMRLGRTIYTGRLMNSPHPMPAGSTAPATTTSSIVPALIPGTPPTAPAAATAAPAPATAQTPAPTTGAASAITATATASSASDGMRAAAHNPLPQALVDDMVMMKALSQYHNVAVGPSGSGTTVDLTR